MQFPVCAIQSVIDMVNRAPNQKLSEQDLSFIESLSSGLANRKLKGFTACSEEEVLALPPQEVDLARALFLSQENRSKYYEAMLDLMALQIRGRLQDQLPETIIRELNYFIFYEMNFRFPPHSVYAADIDLYTFLPSVLDSRKGVCLGVSILYLCLAQRLDLPLEVITPPGHIYVRYRQGSTEINIETTARGVHLDSEEYLSVDTRSLEQRSYKDTIGLTHINLASVYLQSGQYEQAVSSYRQAERYLPDDQLLKELMGYALFLSGARAEALIYLKQVRDYLPEEAVSANTAVADLLDGRIDARGIEAIYQRVDETKESLLAKRAILEDSLKKYPLFRSGWLQLATLSMQMRHYRRALECLENYHQIDDRNVSVEYFLAVIYAERMDYTRAWNHLRHTEKLLSLRGHTPKAVELFRRELTALAPE